MRHARILTLLGVLAAPPLAQAQSAGQVVPAPGEDPYFNGAECSGTGTIELSYQLSAAIGSGYLKVYAQDTQPVAPSGSTLVQCEESFKAGDPPIYAGQLNPPGDILAGVNDVSGRVTLEFSRIATAAHLTCTDSTDSVWVCVHYYAGTNPPATDPSSTAIGKLTLDTNKPAAPSGLALTVGDRRLHARWTAGTGGAAVKDYRIVATPVPVEAGDQEDEVVTGTSGTVGGLVNDQKYDVVVYARSQSGTESDPSEAERGTPHHVLDFWEMYETEDGPEAGGCGAPAGPLALLLLAGGLALAGRGRRQ